jgi:hypothetical protein
MRRGAARIDLVRSTMKRRTADRGDSTTADGRFQSSSVGTAAVLRASAILALRPT